MGRPRKEGMDYFPHDVDAAQDEKIEAMRTMFGNDGYAFYFICLERIYRSDHGELDVSKKLYTMTLANKVMVQHERLEQMMQAAVEFGLFDKDVFYGRGVLTSNGIKKRSVQINGLRDKWRKNKDDTKESFLNGKPQFSTEFSQEKTLVFHEEKCIKESKGKESKGKESKEEIESKHAHAEFVHLTKNEHDTLLEKYGSEMTAELIRILDNYKGMTGKKYESDYRAIISWCVDRYNEDNQKQTPKQSSKPAPDFSFPKPTHTATGKPNLTVASAPVAQPAVDMDELYQLAAMLDSKRQPGTLADMTYAVTEPLSRTPKENDE